MPTLYCELILRDDAPGYTILHRTRIVDWYYDAKGRVLPVTTYGQVDFRAFTPKIGDAQCATGWIETREDDGSRRWWSPIRPEVLLTDGQIKKYLADLAVAMRSRRPAV